MQRRLTAASRSSRSWIGARHLVGDRQRQLVNARGNVEAVGGGPADSDPERGHAASPSRWRSAYVRASPSILGERLLGAPPPLRGGERGERGELVRCARFRAFLSGAARSRASWAAASRAENAVGSSCRASWAISSCLSMREASPGAAAPRAASSPTRSAKGALGLPGRVTLLGDKPASAATASTRRSGSARTSTKPLDVVKRLAAG